MHALGTALKLAVRPWRQTPLSQWFSVVTLGFILTAVAFSAHLSQGFREVELRLGREQIATVYLAGVSEEAPARSGDVTDEIRLKLGSAARSVTRVTGEEFLKTIEARHPELAAEVSALGPDLKLIAPEYVTVRGAISPEDAEKLKLIPGVEAVDLSAERLRPLLAQATSLRAVLVATALLLAGCFLVVMNLLAQVNRNLHRESEALLSQLGGSKIQVKAPALADLAMTGFLAGLVSIFLWAVADAFLLRQAAVWSPMMKEISKMPAAQLLLLPVAGTLLGVMSAQLRRAKATA